MRPMFATTKSPSAKPVESGVRVTGIFSKGDRRVAVVNGQVVKAGDRVGDVLVKEVSADGVKYERAGRIEVARLPKQAAQVRSVGKSVNADSLAQE